MATLYVTEYIAQQESLIQASVVPPVAEQTVAIGGASVASAAFNPNTTMVRIHPDAICSIAWGYAPVATATNMRLPANISEYFMVRPGMKVAVITNS
jgi:hypothetical protein